MNQSGDIIRIGDLSVVKVLLVWMALTLLLALTAYPILSSGGLGDVLALLFLAALWLMSCRCVYVALFRGRLGLYIQDGLLHDALFGSSAPVETIRAAYRNAPRGIFKTTVVIDIGGPKPISPAYPELNRSRTFGSSALLYETPPAVMLERLEACGVKIKGSKTALLGL